MSDRDSELDQLLEPVRGEQPDASDIHRWSQSIELELAFLKRHKQTERLKIWKMAAAVIIGIGIGLLVGRIDTGFNKFDVSEQTKKPNQNLFAIKYYCH